MKTTEKITEEMKNRLIVMYNEGKMDPEIAKELNVSKSAILYWRKKLNLPSKFEYSKISKINNSEFEKLFYSGISDYDIAKQLNMSPEGVYSHRIRHGYNRNTDLRFNKPIALSDFQKQVLLGTVLGDSSLENKKGANTYLTCAHGIKQKDYCIYKTQIFESLGAKCTYHKRKKLDKRTGIYYEDYTMYVPSNPKLNYWHDAFYKNGKKVIPFSLFKYFTEVSLAFMFMDDGTKIGQSYSIATNCFSTEEILEFRKFLFNKFNIETTMFKSNIVYIKKSSSKLFTKLISPYICECMKYKLHVS